MWINGEVESSTSAEQPAHIGLTPCKMEMKELQLSMLFGPRRAYMKTATDYLKKTGGADHGSAKRGTFCGLQCMRAVCVTHIAIHNLE